MSEKNSPSFAPGTPALRQESRVDELFEQAEGAMLIHEDGVIVRINQPAIKIFDSSEDRLLFCHLGDFVIRESLPKLLGWLANDRSQPLFIFVSPSNEQCFPLRLKTLFSFARANRRLKVVELSGLKRPSPKPERSGSEQIQS